jgi:hypothetical protein
VKPVSELVLKWTAEKGMHLVVCQSIDFYEEAEGIGVYHLVTLKKCLSVDEGHGLVAATVSDDKEGVDCWEMLHE